MKQYINIIYLKNNNNKKAIIAYKIIKITLVLVRELSKSSNISHQTLIN